MAAGGYRPNSASKAGRSVDQKSAPGAFGVEGSHTGSAPNKPLRHRFSGTADAAGDVFRSPAGLKRKLRRSAVQEAAVHVVRAPGFEPGSTPYKEAALTIELHLLIGAQTSATRLLLEQRTLVEMVMHCEHAATCGITPQRGDLQSRCAVMPVQHPRERLGTAS